MNGVLAIIVSYHPEDAIVENVTSLVSQVQHVVVVDNESSEQSKELLLRLPEESVTLIYNEKNNGVAQGFNQGIKWGLEQGFNFFLLLDQDSKATPNMVKSLMNILSDDISAGVLSIVGPRHEDFYYMHSSLKEPPISNVELLITSGSLIPKQVFERIGFYDERLFIDHVDHDFCLRFLKNGGQVRQLNDAVLLHRFGEAKRGSFLGRKFFLQNYSPFRRYFMMRNRIVLYKRFGVFKGAWFWIDLRNAIKDFIKLLFFESNRAAKLKAVMRGIQDGINWRD